MLDNASKSALWQEFYDDFGKDSDLATTLEGAFETSKIDGYFKNAAKQRRIKAAFFEVFKDKEKVEQAFEIVIAQAEKTADVPDKVVPELLDKEDSKPDEPSNYRINEQFLSRTSFGEKARFKDNVQAIKILRKVEDGDRAATADELETLAKYAGWGGISQAFNAENTNWATEYTELKKLLTEQEYREALSSTLSAYYTNPTVIKAVYDGLEHIGIIEHMRKEDALQILEPALGVGNFFGAMPEELRDRATLHGVELDSISARIAQKLYPKASIQNVG
jgi:hypothetical protein